MYVVPCDVIRSLNEVAIELASYRDFAKSKKEGKRETMSTENDKPFVCPFHGCGQRFTNNDHLLVHQQKHEFSLKFGALDRSLLVDQTPTPTRFLKHCDETGLFQELESNPFDQDFQKVTSGPGSAGKPQTQQQQHDGAGLRSCSEPGERGKGAIDGTEMKNSGVVATITVSTSTPLSSVTRLSSTTGTSIPVAPPANLVNPDKTVPMASAPPHVSNASVLTKQKLLQSIQVKEQQKLFEQQLGLTPSSQELLAQALKNAIAQTSPSLHGADITDTPTSTAGLVPREKDGTVDITVIGTPELPGSGGKRRRGRKPDEEEPELKRQRFLERNRAAASRCRAKKKVWVENLEHKSKEVEGMNHSLQQEVVMLRSEVQQLKSILIAHKDCPLIVHQTLPQKTGEGGSEGETSSSQASALSPGITLLSQLAHMPSMSPLIASPIPSVGSVVPNIGSSFSTSPATIIITSNGLAASQHTPEVAKDVEITAECMDSQETQAGM